MCRVDCGPTADGRSISKFSPVSKPRNLGKKREGRQPMASAAGKPEGSERTVTKADLIEEVIRVTELPRKESETVVETVFESIIEALQKDDKIEIRGFGRFRTRQRRGRLGRNPKTGAKVEVPPKRIPFFKPSKELKDFVNGDAAAAAAAIPPHTPSQ